MRTAPLLALALLVALAGCDDEPVDPAQTVDVAEADVERFRAEIFEETLGIDAALARLEEDAAAADSATQVAYGPVLDRLRAERRRLQVRIDSLTPQPPVYFDSTQTAVRAQVQRLTESVVRARYEAAPTYAALQTSAARGFADLDARIAALRAAAAADTTGGALRDVDSLAADRGRLAARLGAYADTSAALFPPFRERVTEGLLTLERRADALVADTTRTAARGPARTPTEADAP